MSTSSIWDHNDDPRRALFTTRQVATISADVDEQVVLTDQRNSVDWGRQELLSLLSTSGALAGLCITIVALMNTFDKARAAVSIVDDLLAVCAAAFLSCIYLILWTLR
jgi:hypothetical protein